MFKDLLKFIFFVCAMTACQKEVGPKPMKENRHSIDEIITRGLEQLQVPGMALAVVVNGEPILIEGHGYRDLEHKLPVDAETVFAIGSCTKAFTALLIGQLVDEGKVQWDDPVVKYLPEFRLKDPTITEKLTIRDILSHQSGLPGHELMWTIQDFSRVELVRRLRYLDFSYGLREKYQYNNLMYVVAGQVIEAVTGQSWENVVKSRILMPLGMEETNFSVAISEQEPNVAFPYLTKNGIPIRIPFRNIDRAAAAGSINSTASDMVKWVQLQLSNGQSPLISMAALQAMHSVQIADSQIGPGVIGYGLGWVISNYKGETVVEHGGGTDGFAAYVALVPEKNVGVVILTNSGTGGKSLATAVKNTLLDQLLNLKHQDWLTKATLKSQDNTQHSSLADHGLPPRPLHDYIGIYEHPAYGEIIVTVDDEHLVAKLGITTLRLFYREDDRFFAEPQDLGNPGEGMIFTFTADSEGGIDALQAPLEPTVKPIVFKRQ